MLVGGRALGAVGRSATRADAYGTVGGEGAEPADTIRAMGDLDPWQPLSAVEAERVFRELPAMWWVAGGLAIDAFPRYESRTHGDLDVAVLRRDQAMVQRYLADWELYAAVGNGKLEPWQPDYELPPAVHDLWCRRTGSAPWSMQLMLVDAEADQWRFRRDNRVHRPLAHLTGQIDGTPYLAVEVQLLYKARDHALAKNDADFRSCSLNSAWSREAG